jgi:hypothetical protein
MTSPPTSRMAGMVAAWLGSRPSANSIRLAMPSESGSAGSAASPVFSWVSKWVKRHCSSRVWAGEMTNNVLRKSKTKSRRAPFVPSFQRVLLVLLPAAALASTVVAQDKGATRPERPWPVAVDLADARMTSELSKRLMASFDRLEEPFHPPPALLTHPTKDGRETRRGAPCSGSFCWCRSPGGRPRTLRRASMCMRAESTPGDTSGRSCRPTRPTSRRSAGNSGCSMRLQRAERQSEKQWRPRL